MKRSELLSIFLLSIFALSTMSIDDGNKSFQQSVKNISSDSTKAYPWINTPKRERDYFHLDEFQNLCGSVKSIKEFVIDEKDSLKQIVRKAEYDLNGNLSMILYNIAHDITSRDVISSKDSSSFYWQYKFEYKRNRLKSETRINGESGIIVASEIPKKQSLLKKNIYEILDKNRKTGLVYIYQRSNKTSNRGLETISCQYDSLQRKIKETVNDVKGKTRSTSKIKYSDNQIEIMTYSGYLEKKTVFKLDKKGNWIEKIVSYPNNSVYGINRHKRSICYF